MNTTLACLNKVTRFGVIDHRKEKSLVKEVLAGIETKYGKMENNADSLSGGNQQKIALAKWIAADYKCMVFDEPTKGVDVGAKTEIYKTMNQLAESGVVNKDEMGENVLIRYSMGVN